MQDPDEILKKYVAKDMKVLDVGCAMGYFSLPLAKLVGKSGKVVCVDMQEKMIDTLIKRAEKENVHNRIETRICSQNSLNVSDIEEKMDFALAFAVVHEVPDRLRLFKEINQVLKAGGTLLVAEPKGHVSAKAFDESVELAKKAGFSISEKPVVGRSYAVLLRKDR